MLHCHLLIHAEIHIYILDTYRCNDNRRKNKGRMIKTQEDFFRKIFTSHFIARVRKGCSRFACERVLETEHKLHILTPLLWPSRCVFLVLLILGSTPSELSKGPLGRVWLSLPHLVSTLWKSAGHYFGTPNSTELKIIIQCPHDRLLDLWNRMFNCHQAEITVMQFRGYSLPVHHCSGTMEPSPCPTS